MKQMSLRAPEMVSCPGSLLTVFFVPQCQVQENTFTKFCRLGHAKMAVFIQVPGVHYAHTQFLGLWFNLGQR